MRIRQKLCSTTPDDIQHVSFCIPAEDSHRLGVLAAMHGMSKSMLIRHVLAPVLQAGHVVDFVPRPTNGATE
jgi:hypothetical protein